jgi:hypothetical protein
MMRLPFGFGGPGCIFLVCVSFWLLEVEDCSSESIFSGRSCVMSGHTCARVIGDRHSVRGVVNNSKVYVCVFGRQDDLMRSAKVRCKEN